MKPDIIYPDLTPSRLRSLLHRFGGKRVLVIGDMVADEYLIGKPTRVAREAPVLILELEEERTIPGGATNVAVNARTLGAEVFLTGVVGNDLPGQRLRRAIEELKMHQEGLVTDPSRPTSTKTRIMAGSTQIVQQHVVRIDRVDTSEIGEPGKGKILAYIREMLPTIDAVVLSDYENGVISPEIIETCIPAARELNKVVVVDSHGSLFRFQGVTALTPNQPEAELTLGMTIRTRAELEEAGQRLLAGSGAQGVLITRGSEGMSLFEQGKPALHIPIHSLPYSSEVVDTNGAGDTVAATFTLALAAGASMIEAAYMANVAAALVVRRLGCASTTPEELIGVISNKVMNREELAVEVRRRQQAGERAVFTNGCFDLLHLGHVRYLQEARDLGDFLILGLNSDSSVRRLKGQGRPLVPEGKRAEILAALSCIDYVTIFPEATASPLVELLQPNIYVKGGDYANAQSNTPDFSRLPEAKVVQSYGGEICLIPYLPQHSTTELIEIIKQLPGDFS
jgi:rfaE bifunctional protein kinase chain/domain/rfaE bifunctional protein nucleotidyltransferase chain/domain